MVKRKQDQSPTIVKFFCLASPEENEGFSSEGVKLAELETRPTLKTAVMDGWVKGRSLLNPKVGGWLRACYMTQAKPGILRSPVQSMECTNS